MTERGVESQERLSVADHRYYAIGIILAVASFLIYAALVFSLPQVRDARYCCEQSGIAAAVSRITYGSRVGSVYTGVFDLFTAHFTEPLRKILPEIKAELPSRPPGRWSATTLDGNGIGYPLVVTVAFRLFGIRWWAPTALMLILMAVSMAAFLRRFSPTLVTLYFSGLTVMLFTPWVWNPAYQAQIPIGGVRYFSLMGVLPQFYIMLSLLDRQPFQSPILLGVQAAILMIAALVRGSAETALIAIAVVGLILACDRARRPGIVHNFTTVGVAGLVLFIAIAVVVSPRWLSTGRFHTIVWTRATEALGMNPELPIDELNEMYPCKQSVPGGIPPGIGDQGAGCIWRAYVIKHRIPEAALWDKTFDAEFEAVMRRAFVTIAGKYPWLTLQTFAYYKPKAIINAMLDTFQFKFYAYPQSSILLLLASLFIALFASIGSGETVREATVVLLTLLFNIPAYLVAYANFATAGDTSLCCVILAFLALGALCSGRLARAITGRRWQAVIRREP